MGIPDGTLALAFMSAQEIHLGERLLLWGTNSKAKGDSSNEAEPPESAVSSPRAAVEATAKTVSECLPHETIEELTHE